MARFASNANQALQTIFQGVMGLVVPSIDMPVTGKFGLGLLKVFGTPGTYSFVVPFGVTSVRVRMWGGGAVGGGGFTFKTITGLTPGQVITVTVGGPQGTSSFGSFCSATGAVGLVGGSGIGGDVNSAGGTGVGQYGAGAGSLFGRGGDASSNTTGKSAASGGGGTAGGAGLTGSGGFGSNPPTNGSPLIDYIGTGGGGASSGGANGGGGGGPSTAGGFPGGGGGDVEKGAGGLLMVEC